jgi:hypothetical protein
MPMSPVGYSPPGSTPPLTLIVDGADRTIILGGKPLRGHVIINLPFARRDGISTIRVKLRGVIKT